MKRVQEEEKSISRSNLSEERDEFEFDKDGSGSDDDEEEEEDDGSSVIKTEDLIVIFSKLILVVLT